MKKHALTLRLRERPIKTDFETQHPDFVKEMAKCIKTSLPVHGKAEYTSFLKKVTAVIARYQDELTLPTPRFDREMELLANDELNLVIPAWGGVAPQLVDKKRGIREKYLIVRQATSASGVLGDPEFHRLKDEFLTIEEGYVIIVESEPNAWDAGQATMTFAEPGDTFAIHQGNRHGIIAVTDTLILEKASNTLKDDILCAWEKAL